MELRAFAERVLFSDCLEEKLAPPPDPLTDAEPGAALGDVPEPGRPVELRMRWDGARVGFPSDARLERDEERAVLLHFFANHELLATELMALVLLRFPGAPAAFRAGVARTLQEEQEHTRLYLERMRAGGVAFGSIPVNGFFWRSIAPMETPADYVTRLSLTFEQANLDFARHYAGLFARLGDAGLAALFERIYRDEIAHVGYGLKWFRRWKHAGETDWDAFCRSLPFPLSPNRAKGSVGFNREGRRRAGLDEEFIERLEVFNRSKGRTPDVFWFNPDAEAELAGEQEAGGRAGQMSRDLESVLLFLGRRDDVVLLRRRPGLEFLRALRDAGFLLPEIASVAEFAAQERKVARVRPWAWTPGAAELLAPFSRRATIDPGGWDPRCRELFSKDYGAGLSEALADAAGACPALRADSGHAAVCRDADSVRAAVAGMSGGEEGQGVVLKAPFGVAGRGHFRVEGGELSERGESWLAETLRAQGAVVVERWRPRVLDFSVQYELARGGEARWLGFTRLHVDGGGRFRACSVERDLTAGCDPAVARFLHADGQALARFYRETAPAILAPVLREHGFGGAFGIDAFIWQDGAGRFRLRPLVELNPRHTMGRVTLELARRVSPSRRTVFEIVTRRRLREGGFSTFPELAAFLADRNPLRFEGRPDLSPSGRRLIGGVLPLADPEAAEACLPLLRIGDPGWSVFRPLRVLPGQPD